ncbi:MAG: M28 family peptidase, partial [Proteobacteria bacterium]
MKLSPLLFLALFSMAGTCGKQTTGVSPLPWDQGRSSLDLKVFSQAPHPMGSPRIAFLADYLEKQMQTVGLETFRDRWDATVPDPEAMSGEINPMRSLTLTIPMQNVYAKLKKGSDSCVYLVASHYDSKRLETGDGIGANDSGSSSVAVLELMRALKASDISLRCHIMAVWFDGEEAYLPDWRDGEIRHPARRVDNTYGSRHLADSLKTCGKNFCLPDAWGGEKIEGMILLDMVGMPDLKLTRETRSTP